MAAAKETTRQKLINILYLVMLGLVALSINDAALNPFRALIMELNTTHEKATKSIDSTFAVINTTNLVKDTTNNKLFYQKAYQLKGYATNLEQKIDTLINELVKGGDGLDRQGIVRNADDVAAAVDLMVKRKKGKELQQAMRDTRDKMLGLLSPENQKDINTSLLTVDSFNVKGRTHDWVQMNFGEDIPLIASISTLTKVKSDLKVTEYQILRRLLISATPKPAEQPAASSKDSVLENYKLAAVAVTPANHLLQGQPYTAEIALAAYNPQSQPQVFVNGNAVTVKDGRGQYNINTGKEGSYTWTAKIRVKRSNGKVEEYSTPEQKYDVVSPSASVSADKMNVLFVGVTNPLNVNTGGAPVSMIKLTASNGRIMESGGKFNFIATQPGNTTISVLQETEKGKWKTLNTSEFRVKTLPYPRVKFGGKTRGNLSAVAAKAQDRIFAGIEGFDFDVKYTILEFTLNVINPGDDIKTYRTKGNLLSEEMREAVKTVVPGGRIVFDNVYVTSTDGAKKRLDPVSILID